MCSFIQRPFQTNKYSYKILDRQPMGKNNTYQMMLSSFLVFISGESKERKKEKWSRKRERNKKMGCIQNSAYYFSNRTR